MVTAYCVHYAIIHYIFLATQDSVIGVYGVHSVVKLQVYDIH